jgi:hypothetical protein
MKTQTIINILFVLLGVAITLLGVVVWNTVDYHAKCDAVVVTDIMNNRYCVDKATLTQSTSTNYNK